MELPVELRMLLPVPFLEGIWVDPDFRRRGISKALLSKFERWAADSGFIEVGSDVEIGNNGSILAHKAWGYKETERVVYFRKRLDVD